MSQHRAPRRRADRHRPTAASTTPSSAPGRHRQTRTPGPGSAFARDGRGVGSGVGRPSAFLVAGTSAIVVAAAGAMSVGAAQAQPNKEAPPAALRASVTTDAVAQAPSRSAHDDLGSHLGRDGRPATISRNAERAALDRKQQRRLERAAERQAAARNQALTTLADRAQNRARQIEENLWVLPVEGYDITATFGAGGGLWSSSHTGLDFAADYGTPVGSVASGTVTEAGYAGAYGNRVIVTHADGTETWYCHLADLSVSSGEQVDPGTTVGHIGMTGNTTGPHLHFEVRPRPQVPVDPYGALTAHGVRP